MIQKLSNLPSKSVKRMEAVDDAPKHKFRCRWIETVDELEAIQAKWERLLDVAIHPNLLFDPDFLIPAFKHLADDSVRILVVEAPLKKDQSKSVICGLLPLQKRRVYGLPVSTLEIWQHDHCFDCTPLIRVDCATEVLNTVFDFLSVSEKTSLLSFPFVTNEGEFSRVLTEVLRRRSVRPFVRDSFTRAAFEPEINAESYLDQHVSKSIKRNFRRRSRQLEEQGSIEVVAYRDGDSTEELIEDFIRLEASGWKGDAGTALACDEKNREFFMEMATRSHRRGKLSFLAVQLDGRPISMLCDMYAQGVGYAYKTAFDDQMRDYSPGLMAEIHNIDHMHGLDIHLMDSCTAPDNSTMNRVWGSRVRLQSLVVPMNNGVAKWSTAFMPFLQQIRHLFSR